MTMISDATETVTFSGKGQILIPRKLRKDLRLRKARRHLWRPRRKAFCLSRLRRIDPGPARVAQGKGVMKGMMEDRKKERDL